jgi:hypothetical protein
LSVFPTHPSAISRAMAMTGRLRLKSAPHAIWLTGRTATSFFSAAPDLGGRFGSDWGAVNRVMTTDTATGAFGAGLTSALPLESESMVVGVVLSQQHATARGWRQSTGRPNCGPARDRSR